MPRVLSWPGHWNVLALFEDRLCATEENAMDGPVVGGPPVGPDRTEIEPEDYVRWRGSTLGEITDALERRLISALLGDVAGLRLLDLGCGDGALALALARRGARVVGIDRSSTMVEAARQRSEQAKARFVVCVGAVETLPFAPETFDAVVAVTVLCFAERPEVLLREANRILRPGGRLVLGELGRWSGWAAGRRLRAWLGSPLWRRARFHTASELRRLVADAGLEIERVRGAVFYPRLAAAARVMAPYDSWFGRRTTMGAAFIALSATKPNGGERGGQSRSDMAVE